MSFLPEVIQKSIDLKLFLSDPQKEMLCILRGKDKRMYDKFFSVCGDMRKKEISSEEFFSLVGVKDFSQNMLEFLALEKYREYLEVYSDYSLVSFIGKLKRKTHLYEKHKIVQENFPHISTSEDVETAEANV